jgi:hypothetical protein
MGHLEDIKMDYFTHLKHSLTYSLESCFAGLIFLIHGLFPNTLVTTGSTKIKNLHKVIENRMFYQDEESKIV